MKTLVLVLLLLSLRPTKNVTVRIADASGAPLKDELVIIQDLNGQEREVMRALTSDAGAVQPLSLPPGLYRAIATAPYGIWETQVSEFLVDQKPTEVLLRVKPLSSRGDGDIVTVGAPSAELRVVDASGKPVADATVLARDEKATVSSEAWYKTNPEGEANLVLAGNPTVIVVYARDTLTTSVAQPNMTALTVQLQQ
jgi:hypothetical protein